MLNASCLQGRQHTVPVSISASGMHLRKHTQQVKQADGMAAQQQVCLSTEDRGARSCQCMCVHVSMQTVMSCRSLHAHIWSAQRPSLT